MSHPGRLSGAPSLARAAGVAASSKRGVGPSVAQVRACSRQFASGVSVVTTCGADSQPYGLTVTAVLCVSLEPSVFLVSVAESSQTLPAILGRGAFAINILAAGQEMVAEVFASKAGADKFKHVPYRVSDERLPLLRGALATLECELLHAYAGGDHRLLVGEVIAANVSPGRPLLRYDGRYFGVERDCAGEP